jgi:hypothetical protein
MFQILTFNSEEKMIFRKMLLFILLLLKLIIEQLLRC